jgi:hypothetical protein
VLEIHLSGKYTGEAREYLAGKGKERILLPILGLGLSVDDDPS